MSIFESFPAHELRQLARALLSERLNAPFLESMVSPYCHAAPLTLAVQALNQLTQEGMQPKHLALLLETQAVRQEAEGKLAGVVQLVWTGPETPQTSNRDTSIVVRDLFAAAEQEVLLVGYRIRQGRHIFDSLCDRMTKRPHLKVRLILDVTRQDNQPDWTPARIACSFREHFLHDEWPGAVEPEMYYDPRTCQPLPGQYSSLHAKCLVIDTQQSLVTSANFTSAGQERNLEVGALINSNVFASQLTQHFDLLIKEQLLLQM